MTISLGDAAANVVRKAYGLSQEQLAFRKLILGGSAANAIMSGDDEKVLRCWREYRNEIEPEDLSDVLPVQLGAYTEAFNALWFTQQTGRVITHHGAEHLSLDYPWMGATLDGLTDGGKTVFEAKHTSAFAKPEEIRARYLPQITHYMLVCGVERAALSVIYGNHKWEAYDIALDPLYAEQLIDAERRFWECVQTGEPPVVSHVAVPVEAIRKVDMSESNEFGDSAAVWLENKGAARKFESAAKKLKEMVPADAVEAFGHNLKITRAKNGALTIREG